MNPIQQLKEEILEAYPDANLTLSAPTETDGYWWMKATRIGATVIAEWQDGDNIQMIVTTSCDQSEKRQLYEARLIECSLKRAVRYSVGALGGRDSPFWMALARTIQNHGRLLRRLADN